MAGPRPPRPGQKGQGWRVEGKHRLCRKVIGEPTDDIPCPVIDFSGPVIAFMGKPAKHLRPRIADENDKLALCGTASEAPGSKQTNAETPPPDVVGIGCP